MPSRPWPIKILFAFHLLAPVVNLLISSYMSGGTPLQFIEFKIKSGSAFDLALLALVAPLAGLVIFACKRWSYFLYLLLMTGTFAFNLLAWKKNPHLFDIELLVSFFFINVVVVGYFLIPSVRKVYFDERLRWWESEPRYIVGLIGELLIEKEPFVCEIENISLSGARICVGKDLTINSLVRLQFSFSEIKFAVDATVQNYSKSEYGLEFRHSDFSRKQLKNLIRTAFAKQFDERTPTPPFFKSFFSWAIKLLSTGQGILPDIPNKKPVRRKK